MRTKTDVQNERDKLSRRIEGQRSDPANSRHLQHLHSRRNTLDWVLEESPAPRPKSVLDLMTKQQLVSLLAVYDAGYEAMRDKALESATDDALAIAGRLDEADEAYQLLAALVFPEHAELEVLAAVQGIGS